MLTSPKKSIPILWDEIDEKKLSEEWTSLLSSPHPTSDPAFLKALYNDYQAFKYKLFDYPVSFKKAEQKAEEVKNAGEEKQTIWFKREFRISSMLFLSCQHDFSWHPVSL